MKRIAKLILCALAVALGLFVIVLIGINLYLQSAQVQARIQLATEQALGTPVVVKRTLFTPWSGLILSGLSLPDPVIPDANMVEASGFSLRFEFWPLLKKRFVITEITLDSPVLTLRQNDEGRWVLRKEPVRRPEQVEPRPERPGKEPPVREVPEFTVELNSFRVVGGSASFYDRKGWRIGRLEGLDILDGKISADHVVTGTLNVHELEIAGQIHPKRLRADIRYEGEKLAITNIKCKLADGSIRAQFHAVLPRNKNGRPTINFQSEVEGVEIPTLIAEAHGNEAGTSGTIGGTFRIEGDPTDGKSLTGGGAFALIGAHIRPLEVIRQVGAVLRIDELQILDLEQADAKFTIRDERVWIDDLTLRTRNLVLAGTGPVRFDGRMKIDGRLLINERLEKQLSNLGVLGGNFTPSADANYKELTFAVTGRVDRPQTDLLDRLTGLKIGKFGGVLRGLLQPPSRKPERDQDDD